MRILKFLLAVVFVFFSLSNVANAGGIKSWGWWSNNWRSLDFQPYLGDQKISQRSLWDNDTWSPEAWIKDAGDKRRIMRDLYAVNIIYRQYKDENNIPVLEVGDNFINLSNLDRSRVLRFVDYVFEITSSEENGMFYVFYSKNNKEPLGLYNKHGFQSY